MTNFLKTALAAAALVFATSAHASLSTRAWLNACDSTDASLRAGCVAYAGGVFDGLMVLQIAEPKTTTVMSARWHQRRAGSRLGRPAHPGGGRQISGTAGVLRDAVRRPFDPRRSFERLAMQMKRKAISQKDERPADLLFWFGDGRLGGYRARVAADTEVSIGRTNSKRALGFVVSRGDTWMDFVLDRDQGAELPRTFNTSARRCSSRSGASKISPVSSPCTAQWSRSPKRGRK